MLDSKKKVAPNFRIFIGKISQYIPYKKP